MLKKNYYILFNFSGAGSKLLQAQLGNSESLFTLPAYPLIYFPFLFNKWKKNKQNLKPSEMFKLIEKHHASIFDTRNIKGFNGLSNLGKNQKGFIKIPKKKFKNFFINFFDKNKISQKKIIEAIHESYKFATNDKKKNILYHVHGIDIFKDYLLKDFVNEKKLATIRHPTFNFWRRAYADDKIDQDRFDQSDYENLKNYRYINRLRDLYIQFDSLNIFFQKNFKLIRFEDLKLNNFQTLKKISKYLNIKFDYKKMHDPSFNNKKWFGSKIYKGHNKKKNFINKNFNSKKDLDQFFNYEINNLEMSLLPFLKKFNYIPETEVDSSILKNLNFFLKIFLPTKYGLKLFFSRFKLLNISNYFRNSFKECFLHVKKKNYYFNAMYKFKWSYRIAYLIKLNYLRKLNYKIKDNRIINLFSFLLKILIFPILQFELMILYFYRIYIQIRIFLVVRKKLNFIKLLK